MMRAALVFCMMMVLLSGSGSALSGIVYDWKMEPLKAVVEIDTSPPQRMIANQGRYWFNVSNGSYYVTARYYIGSVVEAAGARKIDAVNDSSYDIVVYPDVKGEMELADEPIRFRKKVSENRADDAGSLLRFVGVIAVAVIALSAYRFSRKAEGQADGSDTEPDSQIRYEESDVEYPDDAEEIEYDSDEPDINYQFIDEEKQSQPQPKQDLEDVLEFIKANGGRVTQKEIRKQFPSSEAKISLVISELESKGMVRKIKKGRGNIICLEGQEEEQS